MAHTNDTIADMLTRIRNATMARHESVAVPATRMTRSIARVLHEEGFVSDWKEEGEGIHAQLVLRLKYKGKGRKPIINGLKRVAIKLEAGRGVWLGVGEEGDGVAFGQGHDGSLGTAAIADRTAYPPLLAGQFKGVDGGDPHPKHLLDGSSDERLGGSGHHFKDVFALFHQGSCLFGDDGTQQDIGQDPLALSHCLPPLLRLFRPPRQLAAGQGALLLGLVPLVPELLALVLGPALLPGFPELVGLLELLD